MLSVLLALGLIHQLKQTMEVIVVIDHFVRHYPLLLRRLTVLACDSA